MIDILNLLRGSLLNLAFILVPIGYAGTNKVLVPVPVTETPLGQIACQILFSHYGKQDPITHQDLLASKVVPVWAIEEVFNNPLQKLWSKNFTNNDPELAEIAAQLELARETNRQPLVEDALSRGTIVQGAYADLQSLLLAVRVNNREYRVKLAPRDIPATMVKTGPGIFESQAASRRWVWLVYDYFDVDPELVSATEKGTNVSFLADERDIVRVVPKNILAKIHSFDLLSEMLGKPHDVRGVEFESNWNQGYFDGHFPKPTFHLVKSSRTEERIGYLVVQDLIQIHENENSESLFRNHFGPGSVIIKNRHENLYRHRAHFDLQGNRVEIWKEENVHVPMGNQGVLDSTTQTIRLGESGLIYEKPEALVPEAHTPSDLIYYTRDSINGSEVFTLEQGGWLRVVEKTSGKKLLLDKLECVATRIDEFANGDLLLSAKDKPIYVYRRATREFVEIAEKSTVQSLQSNRIILFHWYRGLSQIPYTIEGDQVKTQPQTTSTTFASSYFENYGQKLHYTRYAHYQLMNEAGDHFIAYDNNTAKSYQDLSGHWGVYRYGPRGMQHLLQLTKKEVEKYKASATTIGPGGQSTVTVYQDGRVRAITFGDDGNVISETDL